MIYNQWKNFIDTARTNSYVRTRQWCVRDSVISYKSL